MLAAHRSAGAFRHHAAVSSWLHRIVVNACLDKLRRNRTHDTLALESDAHPVVDHTPQIDTAMVVRRALAQLPVDQRAAVVAVDMQGYSVADAARLLGVPEGTVKSRAARGRARLAAHSCTGTVRPRAMRRRRDGHWPGELHAAAHGPPGSRARCGWRRPRRAGWPRWPPPRCGTAALVRSPAPGSDAVTPARKITVTAPAMPLSGSEIVGLLDRPPDLGPLGDPARRASCLAGLGYPASTPVLGARQVRMAGRDAVMLVLAADAPGS